MHGQTNYPPFWRDFPLSTYEQILLGELLRAHSASVHRRNVSTECFLVSSSGSSDFVSGVIAALSSLGGTHAPIEHTYDFLKSYPDQVGPLPDKVPGWGNSFVKGTPDPAWGQVDKVLGIVSPEIKSTLQMVTEELHARGKLIFPNPSAYTAAVCIAVQLPKQLCPLFFIQGRIEGWASLFYENFLE